MVELIKLIDEYGKLENLVGFTAGINKGNFTSEEMELRNKRNEKLIQINEMIIKLNERLLNNGN